MGRKSLKLERRKTIIEAFARVLANHGYAGATILAVASEAQLTPSLLHHNFSTKQEMLTELFLMLAANFREMAEIEIESSGDPLYSYIDAALGLSQKSDSIAAKCWVGIFAEALREPALFERIKRHLNNEIKYLSRIGKQQLSTKDCGAIVAFILGSLVFGAYAPRKTSGFAASSGKLFVNALRDNQKKAQ